MFHLCAFSCGFCGDSVQLFSGWTATKPKITSIYLLHSKSLVNNSHNSKRRIEQVEMLKLSKSQCRCSHVNRAPVHVRPWIIENRALWIRVWWRNHVECVMDWPLEIETTIISCCIEITTPNSSIFHFSVSPMISIQVSRLTCFSMGKLLSMHVLINF